MPKTCVTYKKKYNKLKNDEAEMDMASGLRKVISDHPIISFTVVAYLFTFVLAPILGSLIWASLPATPQLVKNLFFTYSPAFAAILLTCLLNGINGARNLIMSLKPRLNYTVYYFCIPFIFLALTLGSLLISISMQTLGELMTLQFLGTFAVTLLMQMLIVGIGEELGWRGFLLEKALNRYSIVASISIVFIVWGIWHLPKFLMMPSALTVVALLISLLAFSVGFTWLYLTQSKHFFLFALMHASFNSAISVFETLVPVHAIAESWLLCSILYLLFFSACLIKWQSTNTEKIVTG